MSRRRARRGARSIVLAAHDFQLETRHVHRLVAERPSDERCAPKVAGGRSGRRKAGTIADLSEFREFKLAFRALCPARRDESHHAGPPFARRTVRSPRIAPDGSRMNRAARTRREPAPRRQLREARHPREVQADGHRRRLGGDPAADADDRLHARVLHVREGPERRTALPHLHVQRADLLDVLRHDDLPGDGRDDGERDAGAQDLLPPRDAAARRDPLRARGPRHRGGHPRRDVRLLRHRGHPDRPLGDSAARPADPLHASP